MSTNAYEKIGVLLVHGVGEQGALQHLEKTTAQVVDALKILPGNPRIDIRTPPRSEHGSAALRGVAPYSQEPTIAIDLRIDDREVTIELNEVWWADLDEPDSWYATGCFWMWGFGQWIAKRYDYSRRYDLKQRAMPGFPWEDGGNLQKVSMHVLNRTKLFLISAFFLMVASTWSLAKHFAGFFASKGLKPVILVQYVGDVKLYQQRRYYAGAPLTDLDLPPRTAITKRMVNALAGMALRDYDRWYIMAHSLGSVVAWDSLNQSPYALANCLSPDVADECRDERLLKIRPSDAPDREEDRESIRPPRPRWINADEVVDRGELFEKLRGLCTYGSPLDKFAFLWPRIVAEHRDQTALGEDFEWVNVFDPTDPVAGALDAFQKIEDERDPTRKRPWPANYGYRAFPGLLLSHVKYLSFKSGKRGRFVNRLVDWILSDDSFDQTEAEPASWMRPGKDDGAIRRRYAWQLSQWLIAGVFFLFAFTGVILTAFKGLPEWFLSAASEPDASAAPSGGTASSWSFAGWLESLEQTAAAVVEMLPYGASIVILLILCCGFMLRLYEERDHRRGKAESGMAETTKSQSAEDETTESDDWPKVA